MCNTTTRLRKRLKWTDKYKLYIQERTGVVWCFGTANIQKNKILTPELLNEESPKFLHRFSWLEDNEIGSLPIEYNWLVGWYKEPTDGKPKILHYTEGGPWFDGYRDCEYADDWKKELINLFSA